MKKCTSINLELTKENAAEISDSLCDILCWIRGFEAGGGHYGLGYEPLRNLSINLKKLLTDIEKEEWK